jgi:hypothetical protein
VEQVGGRQMMIRNDFKGNERKIMDTVALNFLAVTA